MPFHSPQFVANLQITSVQKHITHKHKFIYVFHIKCCLFVIVCSLLLSICRKCEKRTQKMKWFSLIYQIYARYRRRHCMFSMTFYENNIRILPHTDNANKNDFHFIFPVRKARFKNTFTTILQRITKIVQNIVHK